MLDTDKKLDTWESSRQQTITRNALEKAAEWEHALLLLVELQDIGVEVTLVTCNTAISACEKLGILQTLLDDQTYPSLPFYDLLCLKFRHVQDTFIVCGDLSLRE